MTLEKLNFDIYEEYRDTIDRYMELVPCEQKEKVDTATIHVMYAIQDINHQIHEYNSGNLNVSIYYQLMIKTDFLITVIETLYKVFDSSKKREEIWNENYSTILKFRLYRSLTLAHPLETTRYKDFGFGQENDKWCEDVRPKSTIYNMLDKRLRDADYIIEVKQNGKELTEKIPITVRNDILSVVLIGLNHLKLFTNEIVKKIKVEIENLKNITIQAQNDMDINDYINALLADIERRYSNEIETIVHSDNKEVKHCILYQALDRLNYTFADPIREEKYKAYKEEIRQAVYAYGVSVQNMDLEETQVHESLSNILYPDSSVLSNKSPVEQSHYRYSKIAMYLPDSTERSAETAREKLEKFSYNGCQGMGICTNAEWGVIQLLTIQNEFAPYFPIDFSTTDKELFFQFCTALYYANKSQK